MKKLTLSCLLSLLIFTSCNENRIYESHIDTAGLLEWNRDDVLLFDIEIIDASIKYNQIIAFRHAIGYTYSACSLKIIEKTPSGEVSESFFTIVTVDDIGYKADCSGDICDLETVWNENRKFDSPGIYHYEISHEMTNDKIHMVMEVGMILDKVEN